MHNAITDVPGIKVGHWTDREHATGCTVVLCEDGAVAGVDVRGSSPGTRETDLLRPASRVPAVNAILLSGGSAYGLDAASGVMRYLEGRGIGFMAGGIQVPIVPGAILFDLALVTHRVRPDAEAGYQACLAATDGAVEEGTAGAGTGATVAKALGMGQAMKGGVGTASVRVGESTVVGAIAAVNAYGDVVDPEAGVIVAGPRRDDDAGFHDSRELILSGRAGVSPPQMNTTLVVVACNAFLDRQEASKLAQQAQNGLVRAVRPANTMGDGDIVFALATAKTQERLSLNQLGVAASHVVAQAIVRAVRKAEGLGGVPSVSEYSKQ